MNALEKADAAERAMMEELDRVVVKSVIETCLRSALLSRSGGALDPRGGQFASKDPLGDAEPRDLRAARKVPEASASRCH